MIRIENVTKTFGDTVAVNDLSIHVKPGELFGLLGPNGAGKTTTIKMLAGLLVPTKGTLTVAGANVVADPLTAKQNIGFVPDKPFVYEKLTGAEFLEFTRDIYQLNGDGGVKKTQEELIELFSLTDRIDELIESYSHGMRQKLILAAALGRSPKALIIDEPMVGLDARGMRQVKSLFRDVADRGGAALLSTHTMSVAQEVCDRIGVLSKGRLIAVGSVDELRQRAKSDESDLESIFLKLTESTDDSEQENGHGRGGCEG